MDPSYVTVVDLADLIWTMLVYLLHGVVVFAQTALACFLLGSGLHGAVFREREDRWLRRLGAMPPGVPLARGWAALRIVLGLMLLAPLALGASLAVSLLGCLGALVTLAWAERATAVSDRHPGAFVRRTALAFAAVSGLFMFWEREDNLTLGADLLLHSMEWRDEELAWQHALDPASPKLGDVAPDFELQDPDGEVRVRLSDFRGKRPVALVFGSYT